MPAVVYAPGALGKGLGKTANDLVIYKGGERFEIVAVVDPENAGRDAGEVVGVGPRGIPVVASLEDALRYKPRAFIIGAATVGGYIPPGWKRDIIRALEEGLDVYNGLHHFLSEDPEAVEAAKKSGARIVDVRKPDKSLFRIWDGSVLKTRAKRVLVAGTDCEAGKNIATMELYLELKRRGVKACMVGTGQTMLLLGARGAVIDAIPSDFIAGVVEKFVVEADGDGCEVIVVEGQAAILHPAYGHVSLGILRGVSPTHIVLAHVPGRRVRAAFEHLGLPMPEPEEELEMLMRLNPYPSARLAGLALNTSEHYRGKADEVAKFYEERFSAPAVDPLIHGMGKVAERIISEGF
ncbi:DUF1611 domain-containing protein [Pyrolobus fumarii]|uniref:DUF1611 domain-containing protein n=1 Tax=Pyrolobus fumarii TaxID=54252 RepID=UPI001FCC9D54|nr:DUF1611 domain-containing protein [Pyrolobus fumarii]